MLIPITVSSRVISSVSFQTLGLGILRLQILDPFNLSEVTFKFIFGNSLETMLVLHVDEQPFFFVVQIWFSFQNLLFFGFLHVLGNDLLLLLT